MLGLGLGLGYLGFDSESLVAGRVKTEMRCVVSSCVVTNGSEYHRLNGLLSVTVGVDGKNCKEGLPLLS